MTVDGVNLGSAYGRILIDTSGVDEGMERAQQSFGRGLQSIGDSVSSVGASLTLLTAPLTAFGATGLRTAGDFQAAMTQISARTGLVGDDLERVRQFALQMGADTVFSGQQAADAFLQLLTSGQNAEQAMQTLPMVLNAAAASGEDLGQTADVLTDIMAAFGLEIDRMPPRMRTLADELGVTNEMLDAFGRGGDPGDSLEGISAEIIALADALDMSLDDLYSFAQRTEDASTVVESLARAAGASSADMASLGQGFANVGPVARNFGMSVDQVAATLAVMAENGIKGSEAGTALKSMLLNMSNDTKPVRSAWRELGLSMYDAEGNMRDMQTVLWELDRALDGLPVEQQNQLMRDLAGSYGITAFSALRGELSIQDMRNAMDGAAGASEVASAMMDTFKIRVDSLKGSVETLQIEALTPLVENTLTPLIEQVTEFINKITEWVQANPELTSQIVMIAAAIAGLGPVLLVAGKAIGAIGSIISGVGSLFTLLGGPLTLLIGLVAAFVAAYTTNFRGLRDTLEPIITLVVDGLGRLVQSIGWFISDIQNFGLAEAIRGIFGVGNDERAESWLEGVLVTFGMARDTAVSIVATLGSLAQPITAFVEQVQVLLSTFFDQIGQGLPFLQSLYTAFLVAFGPDVARVVYDLFNGIGNVINAVLGVVQGFFNFLADAWALIGPALTAVFDWFVQSALPAVVNFISTVVLPVVAELINVLGRIWEAVAPALLNLLDWFLNTGMPSILAFITEQVVPIVEAMFGFLAGVWELVRPALEPLANWFLDTALPAIVDFVVNHVIVEFNNLVNLLRTIWETVSPTLITLYNWFRDAFQWIGQNFIQPVTDSVRVLIGWVEEAFNALERLLGLNQTQFGVSQADYNRLGQAPAVSIQPSPVIGGERDSGGPGYANLPYLIRPKAGPELFYPRTDGEFIPNFDEFVAQLAGGGGGGDTYVIQMPAEALQDPQTADERGRDFAAAFSDEMRRRGNE